MKVYALLLFHVESSNGSIAFIVWVRFVFSGCASKSRAFSVRLMPRKVERLAAEEVMSLLGNSCQNAKC